jgi:hypothetical protein
MVHALQVIHRLLKPGRTLVDIHPTGEPPPIEIVHDEVRSSAGHLQEGGGFDEYFQADAALAEAVKMGLFALERQDVFEFVTCANSLAEFLDHLDTTWSDAIVAPEVQRLAAELLQTAKGFLEMTERVRVTLLRTPTDPGEYN